MKPEETLVLGAGPVGLIAAEILGARYVVGKDPGGSKTLRNLAPTYLWWTPSVERFLLDLGLNWGSRWVKFGWLCSGEVRDAPSEADLKSYYRRSRGGVSGKVPSSVASSGKPGEIEVSSVPLEQIIDLLLERNLIYEMEVESIFHLGTVIRFNQSPTVEFPATTLVNTLPRSVFCEMIFPKMEFPPEAKAGWKTFVSGDAYTSALDRVWEERELDFLYVADESLPFERVKFLHDSWKNERFVYEFNAVSVPPEFLDLVHGKQVYSAPLQISEVSTRPRVEELGGRVRNVGRLARWDHSIRLHDVIEELYRWRDVR